jgi:HK97 family phage major capsid protein
MQSLKQLQEKRGSLLMQANAVLTAANVEKRDVSAAENIRLDGIKAEIFNCDQDIARIQTEQRMDMNRSASNNALPVEGYSITRAIHQAGQGHLDGLEGELSAEIARRSGKAAGGFYVPHSVLIERRAMSVTGDAGVYGSKAIATEIGSFLEALRPRLAVAKAGATLLAGLTSNIGIPRHVAASTAAWKSENAELSESNQEIDQLLLSPKRIGSWTKLSKQLIVQSSPDVEAFVKNDLMQAIAVGFDAAAIAGTGANDQPTGILSTVGIGDVAGGTNGAAPTWANLVALVSAVANANALGERPAFLLNSKVEGKLRSTVKVASTDSRMILEEGQATLAGHPWIASNNVPSNLTKGTSNGVCSAIVFGNFEDVILTSFGEGVDVVVDPFTLATSGQTRVVCTSLCDVGIRRAASFAAMKDALTA